MIPQIVRRILREATEIEEGGFSRVRRSMLGDADKIRSLGIMTAENPNAQSTPKHVNKELNDKLKQVLRSMGYGFIPFEGSYGMRENSFLIPNISRADMVYLGDHFNQESVIFGQRKQRNGVVYFEFQFIERGETKQIRNASLSGADIQSRDDFFSAIKDRKFIIPFFDDDFEYTEPTSRYGKRIQMDTVTNVSDQTLQKIRKMYVGKCIKAHSNENEIRLCPDRIEKEGRSVVIYSSKVEMTDQSATKIHLLEKLVDHFRKYFNVDVIIKTNEFTYPKRS